MRFSDEMLMAYADGELDLVARAEIEAAMAVDPEIARSVERHRALRGRVQAAYQGVLDEPVPAQLANFVAAPVTLGLFVGAFLLRGPEAPYVESDAGLVARGELAYALTGQLASDAGAGEVRVGISFRERGGAYCRTFRLQRDAPLAGLACRTDEEWRLQVLAAAAPEEGEVRGAAAMPMAVLQAVDAVIDGEPLDARAEAEARDAGWQ
jgi:anti-sigma factor RsiW